MPFYFLTHLLINAAADSDTFVMMAPTMAKARIDTIFKNVDDLLEVGQRSQLKAAGLHHDRRGL